MFPSSVHSVMALMMMMRRRRRYKMDRLYCVMYCSQAVYKM
jgi:hypothetical protein